LHSAANSRRETLDFLDDLCALCEPVFIHVNWRPQTRDPGDEMVIDAAVNGMADAIATFDLRHLRVPAARFGIAAERPADVLRRIA
jgi:predicted nucleic acid-binding protein